MTTVELPVPPAPVRPAPVRPTPACAVPRPRAEAAAGGAGHVRRAPVRVRLPGRSLVLVAGMPGAGKSTLLAGLPRRPGLVVLDSDTHRAALARLLPGVAYRRYRPLVHLLHRLALVRAACSGASTVVVHLPATAASTRAAVALLAALTDRAAHLVWLHVDPEEALTGQRDRGRLVPSGSFAGHARRALVTREHLRGRRPRGFRGLTLLDRTAARAGLVLETHSP